MKIRSTFITTLILQITFSFALFSEELNQFDVSAAGIIIQKSPNTNYRVFSENGEFGGTFRITAVTDEVRQLRDFSLYKGSKLLFRLSDVPGSDVEISNRGYVVFYDHQFHFRHELRLHFYSPSGEKLISKKLIGGSLFGFSPRGDQFFAGNARESLLIQLPAGETKTYPAADQFAISEDGATLAIAFRNEISIYQNNSQQHKFFHELGFVRKIALSGENNILCAVGKRKLQTFSTENGALLFEKSAKSPKSFRDLRILKDKIIVGIQERTDEHTRGELEIIDFSGKILDKKIGGERKFSAFQELKRIPQTKSTGSDSLPWMFFPFDSMRTAWNYYEQHMGYGGGTYSYLHQGLDLIVPISEPVYAVEDGIVKCVLTLGGAVYWRVALSKEQTSGWSNGWLYAHLIQSTIAVAVGDTVKQHDYIGDIIQWSDDWGHIHFVEISDSGLVWRYDDNEWGINFNPLQKLRPISDTTAPKIENVFPDQKFAFPANNTDHYLSPDSLFGMIDIVAKITDRIGASPWDQPAYETFYWIKSLPGNQLVVPRTLAQRLNHKFSFYASGKYQPYATLIYKRDKTLRPSSWMSQTRNFYHVMTNNNGDEFLDLSEENLALNTADFKDGDYRIFVEAKDINGNSSIDSMDVTFQNGISAVKTDRGEINPLHFALNQNFPNPFNPKTSIDFSLPIDTDVKLEIFDIQGRIVREIDLGHLQKGAHVHYFNAENLAAGIYFYRLTAGDFSSVRKMALVK